MNTTTTITAANTSNLIDITDLSTAALDMLLGVEPSYTMDMSAHNKAQRDERTRKTAAIAAWLDKLEAGETE